MSLSSLKTLRVCLKLRIPAIKAASFSIPLNCRLLYTTNSVSQQLISTQFKMAPEKALPQLFKFVDQNVSSYKSLLKEAVAIPSVSSDVKYRPDCVRMVEWMKDKLKEVGAKSELRDVGYQTIDGKEVKLPPVLVGVLGNVSTYLNFFCIKKHPRK